MTEAEQQAKRRFETIGIMGKPNNRAVADTTMVLYEHLTKSLERIYVDLAIAEDLAIPQEHTATPEAIGESCDLVVVIGGDGSMLSAARLLVNYDVPVIGVNRGHLGFLTDIKPSEVVERIDAILDGKYIEEQRFLLHANLYRDDEIIADSEALNDIVLYPGEISKMLEFEVYIDEQFVYSQRSDGIIVSTPTGSTAYALSGGGPIMHPRLDAVVLVPMFPHTLSARPIVVDINSHIDIVVADLNKHNPQLSCDGQITIPVQPGDKISIRKKKHHLWLLHPEDHDYYRVLRGKLGWGSKL